MAQWQRADQVAELQPVLGAVAGNGPAMGGFPQPQPQPGPYGQPYGGPVAYAPGAYPPGGYPPGALPTDNKKLAAGICAILIGGVGGRKFIFGDKTAGGIMLLGSGVTCGFRYSVM